VGVVAESDVQHRDQGFCDDGVAGQALTAEAEAGLPEEGHGFGVTAFAQGEHAAQVRGPGV